METKLSLLPLVLCCLLAGCARQVRSISRSGYHERSACYAGLPARELDEFDVLGLDRDKPATEEDIQRASRESKRVQLAPDSTILLVQSGAVFPDGAMVAALGKHFRVVPFTGLANETAQAQARSQDRITRNVAIISDPDQPATVVPLSTVARERYRNSPGPADHGAYSRTLRLAAARAGAATVVCYWGILESGSEDLATKTISWIPAVNWIVPDEKQHMRIHLKVAVVDVARGSWSVFSVQPPDSKSWTRNTRREATDQRLVEALKQSAYELAGQDLVRTYSGLPALR